MRISFWNKAATRDTEAEKYIDEEKGVKTVAEAYPEIPVYISTLDRGLNEHCYILPGLGDAGDRLFGTK